MRKVLAFTLAALLFAGPIFVAAPAALAADLGVTQYESSRTYYGSAGEDGMFTLTLSGVNNADGLTVSTGSGSAFILADGMQQFPTFVGGNKIMVPLVYIGSGQNLVIVISRGDDTHEQTLYIKEAIPVAQPTEIPWDPPEEPDYGAEQPRFDISGVLPQLKAGQSNEIKFSLSNNSSYAATNVVVALVDNGEKRLFKPATVSGNSVAVGNMNTGNTKDIAIPVTINADVEQGYYTVGLLITMYNRGRVKVTQTDLSVQVYIANDALSGGAALMTASAAIDSMTPDASGKLNLSVSVTNSGNGTATNTKVTLSGFKAT
ncbi:MAG: hypothetical protein LBR85_07630, partial [Oscillospiraceae bacterium]|nr:hypothetical protein [Oscillospiraceae bacterium]